MPARRAPAIVSGRLVFGGGDGEPDPIAHPSFFVRVQLGLASAILLGVVISAAARSWQSLRAGLFAWFVLAVLLAAGIECIFIFRFELADNDYLIFGEVLEDLGALAREPVMLLRRSYVESQVAEYGSLGGLPLHQERRQLRAVPADDYHIFDADIALRERRLRNILSDLAIEFGKTISAAEAAHLRDVPIARHLESEKDRHEVGA